MRSSCRTAIALIAALSVVAFVMGVIWRINNSRHPVDTANVAAADLGALAVAVPVLMALGAWWWKSRRPTATGMTTSEQAAAAADRLADVMAERWRREASRRRIVTPAPATVRWRWAADDLTSPRAGVAKPPAPGTGPMPLPDFGEPGELLGSGVVSRLHDEVYARLPHGRLVLVGGPGAGKTGAMILLLLAALASRGSLTGDRRARVPVPVWLTLGGWDPLATTLEEWAISTMNRDHPFLGAPDYGSYAARELLRCGFVALFLDGLDDMPEGTRAQALRRIGDEVRGLRVVMTSRTEEYRSALQADRLDNAAVIELCPVRPAAAAAYLLRDQAGPSYQRWERLATHLRQNPDSVAGQALDNPLTLSLTREAYATGDPDVLTDIGKFATVEMLHEHLIDQVLITAYPNEHQRAHAAQWLAWIAHHMGSSRDLLWWNIPTWIPRWQLRLAAGLAAWLVAGLAAWLWFGLWFGLWSGYPGWSAFGRGFAYGLGFGLVSGLAAGLLPRKSLRQPQAVVVRRPRSGELGHILEVEFYLALVCVFAAAGIGNLFDHWNPDTLVYSLVFALAISLLSIPGGWLPFGLLNLWTTPIADSPSATAAGSYRSDRRASMIRGFAVGVAGGFTSGLLLGIFSGWAAGLILGVAGFALGFLAGLAPGQVPMVRLVELVLACQGQGHVHFHHLVEDAFDRQVLRQAGAVYQFRHATLQDRLARVLSQPLTLAEGQVAAQSGW